MNDRSEPAPLPSPFDPYLSPFLLSIGDLADGYAPLAHARVVAAALDCPPAFADALFTSARGRGLLEPYRDRRARNRTRWQLSARGRAWLATDAP